MSDEQEAADRNFRSAYYKSLGVKGSEKSIAHLELLLKADIFDVKKLKTYCLKHTLTVYYRPLVWKVILSVIPVFADNDTASFVREQKRMEFCDLRHALQVMGRLEHAAGLGPGLRGRVGGVTAVSEDSSSKYSQSSFSSTEPAGQSSLDPLPSHSLSLPQNHLDHVHKEVGSPTVDLSSRLTPEPSSASSVSQDHKMLSQTTSRDFVSIFLLENNRLLSASVNQMKKEEQVNMVVIAEAFMLLFEEESEDGVYWLFSGFMKKLESHLIAKEEMWYKLDEILEDIDCALLEHVKDLDAFETTVHVHIQRWFFQCYARDLPESCIECIWDRVIGGSCMILVYLAVATLLSYKRKILGFSSADQLQQLLENIPKDNFGPIVSRAIELWESHGSPLVPSSSLIGPKAESSPLHELHEIEDYS